MNKVTPLACVICLGLMSAWAAPIVWITDSAGNIGTLDVTNGSVTAKGNAGTILTDIAFDPSGALFGINFDSLYRVNTSTGAATLVGSLGAVSGNLNALVFATDGTLYGASNQLYKINPTTGVAADIGPLGFTAAGDLAFLNGLLYLTTTTNSLVTINPATGAGTPVGPLGVSDMFGLAAPGNGGLYGVASTNVYSVNAATGGATLLLSYDGRGLSAANGAAFVTEAVPEPSTFLLLAGGLIVFAGCTVLWNRSNV